MPKKHGFNLVVLFLISQSARCMIAPIEEAPVASRYWESVVFKGGSASGTYKVSKTILKPEGISEVSKLRLSFAKVGRVHAEVIQPDGKRIRLSRKQMDVRSKAVSENGFTRGKQLSFLFPALKVGSTVELSWKAGSSDQRLGDHREGIQVTFLPINERVDSVYKEYMSDQPLFWKGEYLDDFDVQQSGDKKTVKIQQKQPRYYWFAHKDQSNYFRNNPRIVVNTTQDLEKVFYQQVRAWNNLLKKDLPPSIAAVVQLTLKKSPEERVIELLHYIRDHYRYLGDWRSDKRGWLPFSLEKTARQGYGDCKDLSVMLVAMLRASGIEAEPAMVYRGIKAPKTLLPSTPQTNHAIVRAKVGDKIWWLDPTNVSFLPDYIPFDIHDRCAVLFHSDNQVELTQIPREDSNMTEILEESIIDHDNKGRAVLQQNRNYLRNRAIQIVDSDHYSGSKETDRLLIPQNDIEDYSMQRKSTNFLVPSAYLVKEMVHCKNIVIPVGQWSSIVKCSKSEPALVQLRECLQHYLRYCDQADVNLNKYSSSKMRAIFKNMQLAQSFKPIFIQSPWFDFSLHWYDSKKEQGSVCETHFTRKVDWLDHKTITSSEFKQFLDQIEVAQKNLSQTMIYSKSSWYGALEAIVYKHPNLYACAIIGVLVAEYWYFRDYLPTP